MDLLWSQVVKIVPLRYGIINNHHLNNILCFLKFLKHLSKAHTKITLETKRFIRIMLSITTSAFLFVFICLIF